MINRCELQEVLRRRVPLDVLPARRVRRERRAQPVQALPGSYLSDDPPPGGGGGTLGALLVGLALVAPPPPDTWDYLGEGRAPAALADCPAGAVAAVSYSSGGWPAAAWRRFCYFGRGGR
jgi:hypothetical protein